MAGTYTEITAAEVDHFLADRLGFSESSKFGRDARELVYDYRFDTKSGEKLGVVIYTSVDERTGVSRSSGKDAIRVALMWKNGRGDWTPIGSSKRVNRIQTWRKNLQKRLSAWTDMLEGRCPDCGAPLTVRSGEYGKFLGCVRYNSAGCNHTESYD